MFGKDCAARSSVKRVLQLIVTLVLVSGGMFYVWTGLPRTSLSLDPQAAEALAMVQSYPAIGGGTILQAMNEHVRSMKERGQGVRLGEWRVQRVEDDIYEIRVQLRDQGVRGQWFEREFIWHAHLAKKRVNAASLPADGITPKEPDDDPRTVSSLPDSAKSEGDNLLRSQSGQH
ncbi:MAG: hypothetical protein NNA18_05175 [Nitrospira sp.]|nr:hypothetical protein [Nitrospira sp.]